MPWFDNAVFVSVTDVANLPHALRRSGDAERLGRRAEARAGALKTAQAHIQLVRTEVGVQPDEGSLTLMASLCL